MAEYLSQPIVIVDYDPQWPVLYAGEQQRLLDVLGALVLRIEHIGSTAVPGLAAKPIIDISVAVRDRAEVTPYIGALAELGYQEVLHRAGLERRRFSKGPYNEGTHQVHVTDYGTDTWAEPILFRDYLRAHPAVARAYADVKRAAAAQHQRDITRYRDEKTSFIVQVMALARTWQLSGT